MLPLLSIKNLGVSFHSDERKFQALDGITFDVYPGQVLAIVGESGSGKTVTAMSVLRLLPEQEADYESGEILFSEDGKTTNDILKIPAHELVAIRGNSISMIFQEPMTSLNPVMKCGQQIIETIRQHRHINKKQAYQQTIRLLNEVQLPDAASIADRYPHQLSGGQKQRVMIAMAMSCEPKLLIADEPTTALDVTVQQNILSLIKSLQQQKNMGVIFITHDLGLVHDIADFIAVMYRGKIVEYGTSDAVLKTPGHPYTKALLACRPSLHSKGSRLPVVADFFIGEEQVSGLTNRPDVKIEFSQTANGIQQGTLMTIENLSIHFHQTGWLKKKQNVVKAVDDVSFVINRGETIGLVGESGSGKSTLGRALLGLIKPDAGRIYLGDKDITSLTGTEWRDLLMALITFPQ